MSKVQWTLPHPPSSSRVNEEEKEGAVDALQRIASFKRLMAFWKKLIFNVRITGREYGDVYYSGTVSAAGGDPLGNFFSFQPF